MRQILCAKLQRGAPITELKQFRFSRPYVPKDRQTGQVTSIGRLRDGHSAPRGCHAWHSMACHADVSDHEYAVRSVCKSGLSSCATRPPGHAGGHLPRLHQVTPLVDPAAHSCTLFKRYLLVYVETLTLCSTVSKRYSPSSTLY